MTSRSFGEESKERKHLYKHHKQWVVATTIFASGLALFTMGTINVEAQTLNTNSVTSAASTSAASTSAASTSAASTSAASTSAASISAASTSAASTSAASTSSTVNSDVNVITEPSNLSEDQYESWLVYAKEQATIDYELTGRAQEIVMSDATTLHITIGSSSIPRVDAVDVSSYQSWMTQNDFNKLKSLGVKSVIVKVSEGSTYTNPYAKLEISMAKAAGLNIDVYHYAHFSSASAASAEAKYLISMLNGLGLSKNVLIFADMEDS